MPGPGSRSGFVRGREGGGGRGAGREDRGFFSEVKLGKEITFEM
jgi:hypothetical protein